MANSPYCDGALVEIYDRLAVPLLFAAPAGDLVAAVRLRVGNRVLDVGTGTGAAATAAAALVRPSGMVVGIDPSLEMLSRLRNKRTVPVAAARAPDLPFRENCFDAVIANFVLTHVEDPIQTLSQMVRVLRPGGWLGVTSWGNSVTAVSEMWSELVAQFTSADELRWSFQTVIPWDRWFSDGTTLHRALRAAGLRSVDISRRDYSITVGAADYWSMKEASVEGVLLRRRLSGAEWDLFRQHLDERFRSRFGESVTYTRDACIVVGLKHVG